MTTENTNNTIILEEKKSPKELTKIFMISWQRKNWLNNSKTLAITESQDKHFRFAVNVPKDFQGLAETLKCTVKQDEKIIGAFTITKDKNFKIHRQLFSDIIKLHGWSPEDYFTDSERKQTRYDKMIADTYNTLIYLKDINERSGHFKKSQLMYKIDKVYKMLMNNVKDLREFKSEVK